MKDFFINIWNKIDGWFDGLFGLEGLIHNGYNYFLGMHSLFRLLIYVFLAIIVVLGVISFIKKILKVFIVIVLIIGAYLFFK